MIFSNFVTFNQSLYNTITLNVHKHLFIGDLELEFLGVIHSFFQFNYELLECE